MSEVAHGFTSVLGTTQKNSVGSLGWSQSKLVKSDAFTTGLCDTGAFNKIGKKILIIQNRNERKHVSVISEDSSYRTDDVNLRAHTESLGTSSRRESSVTVPTSTATFPSFPFMNLARREIESGALFMLDMHKRFLIHPANLDPVRLDKKLKKKKKGTRWLHLPIIKGIRGFYKDWPIKFN